MGLLGFIKYVIYKTKINTVFDPFFNEQNKKLETANYMDEIPENIKNLYLRISDNERFSKSIKTYDEYDEIKNGHNELVKSLYDKASLFSFSKILKNPKKCNYELMVNEYGDVYQKLLSLKELDKKLKKFKKEYKEFEENYQIIIAQFDAVNEVIDLDGIYDDIYIDGEKKEFLKGNLESKKLFFSRQTKLYYPEPEYPDIVQLVWKHNDNFIKNHLNDSLFDDVNGRKLDRDQREAILTDPKSNLTIAGAGSGKTLTICGKVKYLLEVKEVNPNDILLLSYSNKSARDLESKVNQIASGMNVRTFHSIGLEILTNDTGKKFAVDDSFDAVIEKYFREHLNEDFEMLQTVLTYYGLYLNNYEFEHKYKDKGELFDDLKKSDFVTLKNQLQEFNQSPNRLETIKKELVKSFEELAIANFLFINGIDYEYETTYKEADTANIEKRQYTPDFYFPKYKIYYEHYGIDRNGNAPQYEPVEGFNYVTSIAWKRNLHRVNNTKCIETYSYEFKEGTLFDNLKKRLIENGIEFHPLSKEEISNALNSVYEGQSFKSFINLIKTFISLYKAQYPNGDMFDELKQKNFNNYYEKKRASLFIDICKDIYAYYIKHLRDVNKIDFDDMILKSIDAIDRTGAYRFEYIIVDEFQDISKSRMNFLKKLIDHGGSKLFAVGDDWQAIYRFAGCDIDIFLNFHEYFKDTRYCYITSTHRNSQELQNIAEPFITSNPEQKKKNVKSELHLDKPIKVMYYKIEKPMAFLEILKDIASKNDKAKVLLIGRNNKDIETIETTRLYRKSRLSDKFVSLDFPEMELTFTTAHGSKGLEEDYAVIINADDKKNGFPNKIEDDILLNLVLSSRESFEYAEERRLFYVALTRTRTYTYILANAILPSVFVQELEEKIDVMNPSEISEFMKPINCPECKSGRLVLRETKTDSRKFYGCSNYPYCKYANDDIKQVDLNHRCKRCDDFMTLRRGPYGSFWGCKRFPLCTYKEEVETNTKNNNAAGYYRRH